MNTCSFRKVAVLLISAFAMVACTSNALDEQSHLWTISGVGTLEDSTPQTRALSIGGTDDFGLFNVWMAGEKMAVVRNGEKIGKVTATPSSNPAVATIGGTAEWATLGTFSVNDPLTYYSFGFTEDGNMGYMTWEGQKGSIQNISNFFNYQKADVKVTQVDADNKIIMVSGASFKRIGSLVHFRFMDSDGKLIKPEQLTITAANGKLITRMNFDGTVETASSITVNTEANAHTASNGTVYPGEYPYDVFVVLANEATTSTSYTISVVADGVTYEGPREGEAWNSIMTDGAYKDVCRVLEATGGSPTPPTPVVTPKNLFSVSADEKVIIAHGNLKIETSGSTTTYSIYDNDYERYTPSSSDYEEDEDIYTWRNPNPRDYFYWSELVNPSAPSAVKFNIGDGEGSVWRAWTLDEATYLIDSRTGCSTVGSTSNAKFAKARVNGVCGLILFPDNYMHPSGVSVPSNINIKNQGFPISPNYSIEQWNQMAASGAVFLPANGYVDIKTSNVSHSELYSFNEDLSYWTTSTTSDKNPVYLFAADYKGDGWIDFDPNPYYNFRIFPVRPVREYHE